MITERDLLEAIAECQGQRNPNANTCIKLAAFYTILDHIRGKESEKPISQPMYSFEAAPPKDVISVVGDSEFSKEIDGLSSDVVWPIMDELMETLSVINPRLYNGVMRRIRDGL